MGPPPDRPRGVVGFLLGGPDSWRRVVLAGIVAGLLLAFAAALVAALIDGGDTEPLRQEETPPPAVRFLGPGLL